MKASISSGVAVPKSLLDEEATSRALTVKQYAMGSKTPQLVEGFEDLGDQLLLPRQYGLQLISELGIPADNYMSPGIAKRFPRNVVHTGHYAYQARFVQQIFETAQKTSDFMVHAATGKGKCLAKGTPILMYSGRVLPVESVRVGDLLMGPDSTPRRVLSLARGRELLYRIVPTKGDAYVVNESHILSLVITGLGGKRVTAPDGLQYREGDIVDIPVLDYLRASPTFRHVAKGWRVGVEFAHNNELLVPPYILGVWLGDGSSRHPIVYSEDTEVVQEWRKYAMSVGLVMVDEPNTAVGTYRLSSGMRSDNTFMQALRELNLLRNKHIPEEYLTARREVRLQVLAGIVDTDGCVSCNCFDIVFKSKRLAEDTLYLARSLGFAAYVYPCVKTCQTGASGTYYRIRVSGNISEVPCRIARKHASARQQKKNALRTGIAVARLSEGEYFGFTLDGDHRFLLGDFTVTHNTVCALSVIQKLGRSALVLVDQTNLMDQWIKECKSILGLTDRQIGVVQGDTLEYVGKHVTIAMIQTLVSREYPQSFYDYFGTVVVDEVHTAGAPTFSKTLLMFSAEVRFGVSATIDRRDALQKLLHWNLGKVEVSLLDEHDKSYVYFVESDTVYTWYANISPKVGRILAEVSSDGNRNNLIVRIIEWLYGEAGRDILVVSDRIEQIENLLAMCAYAGIPETDMGIYSGFQSIWKFMPDPTPKRKPLGYEKGTDFCPVMLSQFRRRIPKKELDATKNTKRILFATFGMFAKGVDVPRLSAGVDCTPRSRAQQVHGRILRVQEDKPIPIWVTIRDVNSYRLERQFAQRIDEYVSSSAEVCEWNLDKGVRSLDAGELKKEAMNRCRKLQKMNIETDANGLSTLRTPRLPPA